LHQLPTNQQRRGQFLTRWGTLTPPPRNAKTRGFPKENAGFPLFLQVGAERFELSTSCTPSKRANPGCATPRFLFSLTTPRGRWFTPGRSALQVSSISQISPSVSTALTGERPAFAKLRDGLESPGLRAGPVGRTRRLRRETGPSCRGHCMPTRRWRPCAV
jgi:hypothetical protein